MEFEKSLAEPGPPGGEERVQQVKSDKATVEVFRLSAQFPGPTAARDFVTLLITSEKALRTEGTPNHGVPRHWIMVSRPCDHPDTQPRNGFVRGFYESIEFIREVPRKLKATQSSIDLGSAGHHQGQETSGRQRAATVNQAVQSSARLADPAEQEDNPVEWIMITRSDPGGGIPRFLVERGTPSSICGDAVKFVDWACQNNGDLEVGESSSPSAPPLPRRQSHQSWRGKGLVGIEEQGSDNAGQSGIEEETTSTSQRYIPTETHAPETAHPPQNGLYGMVAGAAASLKPYTPQVVLDRLPGDASGTDSVTPADNSSPSATRQGPALEAERRQSFMSNTSFASAEDHISSESEPDAEKSSMESQLSVNGLTASSEHVHRTKELQRLDEKKQTLNQKFASSRAKLDEMRQRQATDEADVDAKTVERHEKELEKHEKKYQKELDKIEKKQEKERQKAVDRKKKLLDKDEKVRLTRERDEARQELELMRKEADSLRQIVQDLQKENTALVIKLGKAGLGPTAVDAGTRSRGSSMSRKEKKDISAASGTASILSSDSVKPTTN